MLELRLRDQAGTSWVGCGLTALHVEGQHDRRLRGGENGSREQEVTCVRQHEAGASVGDRSRELNELTRMLGLALAWQV